MIFGTGKLARSIGYMYIIRVHVKIKGEQYE
jgi:hypothetical protein